MGEERCFVVFYTKDLHKKKKCFLEGSLTLKGSRATLYSEDGVVVESCFVSSTLDMGEELKLDRHLVQIDGSSSNKATEAPKPVQIGEPPPRKRRRPNVALCEQKPPSSASGGRSLEQLLSIFDDAKRRRPKSVLHSMPHSMPPSAPPSAVRTTSDLQLVDFQRPPPAPPVVRRTLLPPRFETVSSYVNFWRTAVLEEIHFLLRPIVTRWYEHVASKKTVSLSRGDGRAQQLVRKCGLHYYSEARIVTNSAKRKKTGECEAFYLKLEADHCEGSKAYSMHDIWIISSSPSFSNCQAFDRISVDNPGRFIPSRPHSSFVCLVRSCYHGLSAKKMLKIAPLPGLQKLFPTIPRSGLVVTALRCLDLSSEVSSLLALFEVQSRPPPVLRHLLPVSAQPAPPLWRLSNEQASLLARAISSQFGLNEDQEEVLSNLSRWGCGGKEPVLLVHGVFGSGKSMTISAALWLLRAMCIAHLCIVNGCDTPVECATAAKTMTCACHCCQKQQQSVEDERLDVKWLIASGVRVLFCAATNVAVDRVLLNLKSQGFQDFCRVGSKPRVNRELYPYYLQEATLTAGALPNRSDALVVGVTSASTLFSTLLSLGTFNIVLLDEASQIVEPVSLLPLRFGCQHLMAVGDPLQLPPPLTEAEIPATAAVTLATPLFCRLQSVGTPITCMRTQYRCHPKIAGLANTLFYSGILRHGVSPEDRPPVIAGLPPVLIVDAPGMEQRDKAGSYFNHDQSNAVLKLFSIFHAKGISPDRIGAICLYKAQLHQLQRQLGKESPQVSTVDAFQGAEKDCVVVCTTRTDRLGFIVNSQRMNVTLTRARFNLIVVGSVAALAKSPLWRVVVEAGTVVRTVQELQELMV